jgi:menaquinone-dependent protoporphyrinogen oxidase
LPAIILVGYATSYGSTKEVAGAIASALNESGCTVDVRPAREVRTLASYAAVVLGGPLLMFRWHKDAKNFLSRHRRALSKLPAAVYATGPTHDPYDDAEWRNSRSQLDRELSRFPELKPVAVELFGGKYDPAKLRFPISLLVGDAPASDLRDWDAIRAWAEGLAPILAGTGK